MDDASVHESVWDDKEPLKYWYRDGFSSHFNYRLTPRATTVLRVDKQNRTDDSPFCGSPLSFLPRDALEYKARSCDRMSSVRPSVWDIGGTWPHRL